MTTMPRLLSSLVLFCLTAAAISAQSVRWQPAGGVLERGQATDLVLIFENCIPAADIVLPEMTNLTLGPPQQSNQTSSSIINGRITTRRMLYLAYPARPQADDEVVIPSFTVSTDQGDFTIPTQHSHVFYSRLHQRAGQLRHSLGATAGEHWYPDGRISPIPARRTIRHHQRLSALGGAALAFPLPR